MPHSPNVDWVFFPSFLSLCLSLTSLSLSLCVFPLSLCQILSLSFSLSDQCLSRDSGQRLHSPQHCFTHSHGVVFLIALCPPPPPSSVVPLTHWPLTWGQVLAGMIAEPAFLSEYTIFALDQSKPPLKAPQAQVAQVASAVSSVPPLTPTPASSPLPAPLVFLSSLLGRG